MRYSRRLVLVLALLCGSAACNGKSSLGTSNLDPDGGDASREPIVEQCFSRLADGKLGSECAGNQDCGAGLECITAGSGAFDGEGPARGYCTKACSLGSSDCVGLGHRAACVKVAIDNFEAGYCFEGCTVGSDPATSKCHGRSEVACVGDFPDNGTRCEREEDCGPRACSPTIPESPIGRCGTVTCQPLCNTDADCGGSLFCNRRTGLCSATPKPGLPVGEPCELQITPFRDPCRGSCFPRGYKPSGEVFSICTEGCTLGAVATCGWEGPGTGRAEAHCVNSSQTQAFAPNCEIPDPDAQFPGPATGDDGTCNKLCDCNADCNGSTCRELDPAVQQATGRRGVCLGIISPDGVGDPGIVTCP